MRLLSTAAVLALLSATAIVAQEPSAENFSRLRAQVIERHRRSAERLGVNGFDGHRLDANVSQIFGIPGEVRVIEAAEVVFRDQRRLTLTFSTNSTHIVITEMKKVLDGASLLTVFHTDLTLALLGAAAGVDANSLRVIPIDTDASSAFRDVLLSWDLPMSRMLEAQPLQ